MRVEDLFNRMPREFGLHRQLVKTRDEMDRLVMLSNGVVDVYVSLYSCDLVVDKIFFDLDSNNLEDAYRDAVELFERLKSYKLTPVALFSGRKGFHIYVPLKPFKSNIETIKVVVKDFQETFSDGLKTVDRRVIGDVRRMVRYPNTLNVAGKRYCVPLPSGWQEWDVEKIVDYSLEPRNIEFNVDFVDVERIVDVDYHQPINLPKIDLKPWNLPHGAKIALMLLRPCVANVLLSDSEPPHVVRLDMVSELMWLGWSEEQVVTAIKQLAWKDFNESVTRYQVSHIFRKRYLPPSCSKLKHYVACNNCGWYYWWGRFD